jgi:uncharacterized protein (DUF58 family)
VLLRDGWLPLGVGLIVVGLATRIGALVGLGLFVLIAGWVARAWADRALDRVEFRRVMPERRAFPGERLRLTYTLANRKLIPLPRIEFVDSLPELLTPPDSHLRPSGGEGISIYERATHLGSRERASWSLDLSCPERGFYRLGPARLKSGDGFGLFTTERDEPEITGVVVYPRTTALQDLGLPAARPIGELKGRQRIFEDPLRIAGVRDYEPGDSIRRVDWKATARRGQLQSRVYEPSTTQHLYIALNVDTLERAWQGYLPEVLEANLVVAASIARWAHEARYAVGLLSNGVLPESDRPIEIAPGRRRDQLPRILEALGGLSPITMASLADQLERESHSLPFGSTFVVVTALMPEPLAAVLQRLHRSGHHATVLTPVDDDWSDFLGDVPVQRIDSGAFAFGASP